MKIIIITVLLVVLVLLQAVAVSALTASDAKQDWFTSKQESQEAQTKYNTAKLDFAADQSTENNQKIIDTGKDVLNAALDEVEAWLIWKNLEAVENSQVPEELKDSIEADVEVNLAKIDLLRADVANIENKFELGVVFLKMIGKYVELLADVGRNSGKMWVHIGETHATTIENYETKLRATASEISDNDEIIQKLDLAEQELESARRNINNAETAYEQVKVPGTPLIKFSEGNNYLKIAKTNLLSAHRYLNQAYNLIIIGGR